MNGTPVYGRAEAPGRHFFEHAHGFRKGSGPPPSVFLGRCCITGIISYLATPLWTLRQKKRDEFPLVQQSEALLKELTDLEARVRKLRMEDDILKKASELIKKTLASTPLGLQAGKKRM